MSATVQARNLHFKRYIDAARVYCPEYKAYVMYALEEGFQPLNDRHTLEQVGEMLNFSIWLMNQVYPGQLGGNTPLGTYLTEKITEQEETE